MTPLVTLTLSGSSKPSMQARCRRAELVEAAIARTEAVNPTLNGLVYEAYDRARARAGAARPYGGYFDGVPSFIKDNVAVAGMPTMDGTDAWTPRPKPADGDFARAYLATGLAPLGKTQMSEFGFSASAEHPRLGAVRNPWNPDYTAGASSSGSGAFVAAGVVPIAHANDGGGSIRIPAACNGLVGLKPSRGRLPLDKDHRQMPLRIVANGVVTRSVRDTAAFYREMERVTRNPKLPAIGDVAHPGKQRLRIAVVTQSILREAGPEVRELTLKNAALLEELGHKVTAIDNPIPTRFIDDFLLYWAFLAFALVRGGRRTFGESFDRTRLDNLSLGLEKHAARNLHKVPLAIARLSRVRRITARLTNDLRRGDDADTGRGDATHRPSRPHSRLPADHRSARRVGGVHPIAERHRRTGNLVAACGIRIGSADRHDVRRARRPRGQVARAGVRARRGAALGAHSGLRV